jgi:hypothetical protein
MLLQSTLFFASLSCGASFVPSPSTTTTTTSTTTSSHRSHRSHHAAAFEFRAVVASTTRSTTVSSMRMSNQEYSAEWIDLLSPNSYSSASSSSQSASSSTASPIINELPRKIYPPRSGGLSFTTPDHSKLLSFAGYAEEITPSTSAVDRFVVNDLWEFIPYYEQGNESSNCNHQWGWNKVLQNEVKDCIPGPRLATALKRIGVVRKSQHELNSVRWSTTKNDAASRCELSSQMIIKSGRGFSSSSIPQDDGCRRSSQRGRSLRQPRTTIQSCSCC